MYSKLHLLEIYIDVEIIYCVRGAKNDLPNGGDGTDGRMGQSPYFVGCRRSVDVLPLEDDDRRAVAARHGLRRTGMWMGCGRTLGSSHAESEAHQLRGISSPSHRRLKRTHTRQGKFDQQKQSELMNELSYRVTNVNDESDKQDETRRDEASTNST